MLTNKSYTLLTVAVVLLLVYFLFKNQPDVIHNEGALGESKVNVMVEENDELPHNIAEESEDIALEEEAEKALSEMEIEEDAPVVQEKKTFLQKKFNNRNKSQSGYKKSSYSGSQRGQTGDGQWSKFFENQNNIAKSQQNANNQFEPIDETDGGFASFKSSGKDKCGSNRNCDPEDLFDASKMLPREVNNDFFDVQKDPIDVNERHLINVTKHFGVDTIGTSRKNAGHDLRPAPANPKIVVSPFLNTTIEPDYNIRATL